MMVFVPLERSPAKVIGKKAAGVVSGNPPNVEEILAEKLATPLIAATSVAKVIKLASSPVPTSYERTEEPFSESVNLKV
jgi:hypothetical protein